MNRTTSRPLLTLLLAAAALLMGLTTPASGSPTDQDRVDATPAAPAATSGTGTTGKPAPPDASDVDRPTITAKPRHAPGSTVAPLAAWSVQAGFTPGTVRPGQSITATAFANQDVGPTPYWISLVEYATPETPTRFLAICGTGSTCHASITHSIQVQSQVVAFISLDPRNSDPGGPLPGEQANSFGSFNRPSWEFGPLALAAVPSTVPVGGATVLTASTDSDIGPTPYWITIVDATYGVQSACGAGTTCQVTLTAGYTSVHYDLVAFVSANTTTVPPADIQASSNTITADLFGNPPR